MSRILIHPQELLGLQRVDSLLEKNKIVLNSLVFRQERLHNVNFIHAPVNPVFRNLQTVKADLFPINLEHFFDQVFALLVHIPDIHKLILVFFFLVRFIFHFLGRNGNFDLLFAFLDVWLELMIRSGLTLCPQEPVFNVQVLARPLLHLCRVSNFVLNIVILEIPLFSLLFLSINT